MLRKHIGKSGTLLDDIEIDEDDELTHSALIAHSEKLPRPINTLSRNSSIVSFCSDVLGLRLLSLEWLTIPGERGALSTSAYRRWNRHFSRALTTWEFHRSVTGMYLPSCTAT